MQKTSPKPEFKKQGETLTAELQRCESALKDAESETQSKLSDFQDAQSLVATATKRMREKQEAFDLNPAERKNYLQAKDELRETKVDLEPAQRLLTRSQSHCKSCQRSVKVALLELYKHELSKEPLKDAKQPVIDLLMKAASLRRDAMLISEELNKKRREIGLQAAKLSDELGEENLLASERSA